MIFLKKKARLFQDNGIMWTIYYDSSGSAKYKITLYAKQYFKLTGALYSIWIENRDGRCLVGQTGEGYAVHYPSGSWDWDTYFGKVKSLGWGSDVREGLPDTDPRVKEIVNDPEIKKLLDGLLVKYSKEIIHDVFERFEV